MALEIAGSRLLAPHFGNSVFVWGSLISVFLIALSAGYLVGGRLVDRAPSFARLNAVCLVAAVLIAAIPWVGHPLCGALLGMGFQEMSGPLVAAGILFLPPSFLLGMVSPFSVRLAARDVESVGRAAGTLYALSTVGSIAGTLATTFVLIPTLGVPWIFRGLAALLLATAGGALLLGDRRTRGTAGLVVPGLLALLLPSSPAARLAPGSVVHVDEDTPYHHVTVVDDPARGVRLLKFDRYVESSMQIDAPHRSLSSYTHYFHLAFLVRPELRHASFIGAGGGLGPRAFAQVEPDMTIDVVDVDKRVLEVAERWFHMPVSERVRPVARDGRMFLRDAEPGQGCIVLDAFTIGGRIPFHLTTVEAFGEARERLATDGVFVMNINSALEGERAEIFHAVARTLTEAFPTVYAFAVHHSVDGATRVSRNVIFVATLQERRLEPEEWLARVDDYPLRGPVTRPALRRMIADWVELPDLTGVRPLTDELAPIETMRF